MKGLGDLVEKITKFTGIKAVTDALPFDCGCEQRKEKLNKMFPFSTHRVMTEHEKKIFETTIKNINPTSVSFNQRQTLTILYNSIFNTKLKPSSCSSCITNQINQLAVIYENSCDGN